MKLRRQQRISIRTINDKFSVVDRESQAVILNANDTFSIYFKNANLISDGEVGVINGTYLGEVTENSSLFDDYCKDVTFKDGKWIDEMGNQHRTARMIAVNSKTGATIIIES